jgi:hypothetical protein
MRALDVQDLLEYTRAAVAVLRTLQILDTSMTYADFGRAVGILTGPDDVWKPWHRQQVEAVLKATAAIERMARTKTMALEYERIVNKRTGQAGRGIVKRSRIVTR